MTTITEPLLINDYRRDWVRQVVAVQLGDDHPQYSDYEHLVNKASEEAAAQALAAGHYPKTSGDRWETAPFDRYLHDAIQPIENIYWSFPRDDNDRRGRVWRHRDNMIQDVKGNRLPEFMRLDIEQAAGAYVNAPVKTATVDRLMVDLLVGMEFAQYAQSTVNAPHVPLLAPNVLKRNLILEWFGGRVIAAIMGFVGYALFWGLNKIGLFPEDWLWLVGLILTCLWLLEAAWGTIMLPKVWMASRKAKKTILGLLNHMSLAYASLASSGPISAQHVTGLLNRGTEAGVIWPGPLHVLMEDITARGGRF